jgi:hypothetical protein
VIGTADARSQRVAYVALIALTVAVGVVTFVLSFYGLRDYGIRVEHLSEGLAPLVPVGVDVLSLCGVAGTYLLRNERLRVRAYAWLVFGTAVSLSVAGNITHAVAQKLDAAGMVGAAAWPILLALAAHFVIVTRRALERRAQPPTQVEADSAISNEPALSIAPEPVAQSVTRDARLPARLRITRPATQSQVRTGRPAQADQREQVRAAYAAGEGIGSIMKRLNGSSRSRRTLEGWTADLREVHAQARTAAQAQLAEVVCSDG